MSGIYAGGASLSRYVRRGRGRIKIKEEELARKWRLQPGGWERRRKKAREPWQLAILTRSLAGNDSPARNLIAGSRGSDTNRL